MSDEIPVETTMAVAAPVPGNSPHHLRGRILSGSFIMLVSSVFVGGMNLVYNFVIAHKLGADNFGHASVVYTLLMLLSSVTLSFQLVCSKFVARTDSHAEKIAVYRLLHRWSWLGSITIGALLAMASGVLTGYLNLPSRSLMLLLAGGTVFYAPLGVRRGFMQGTYDFRPLALNFCSEVAIKLIGAVLLIAHFGVEGVVAAMATSILLAYFIGVPRRHHGSDIPGATLKSGVGEGLQAATFFVGQVIINNLDIILVKHFFDSTQAGVYAAVALVGRVVYILSWSIVSSMFPFSAGIRAGEKGGSTVLTTALMLVGAICGVFVLGVWLAPASLWHLLLGAGFPVGQHHFYSSLLILYVVTTALYALGVVLMTYEISKKIGRVSWVQLAFSGFIVAGIYLFHSSLQQVILVQLVLMLALLATVCVPFVLARFSKRGAGLDTEPATPLRRIRRVEENEVIAEFLRGEFYHPEFVPYRKTYADLVDHPNLNDERENLLRRALLFRRRGRLWRELPADTQWWEVELSPEDMKRVRVFARNDWLRYGAPGFLLLDTVERVRSRIRSRSRDPFIIKLKSLSVDMVQDDVEYRPVLLISVDDSSPLGILEGNHRMTAGGLVDATSLHRRFRFICGFSPRMLECCWYRTDASTLLRYAVHSLTYYLVDRQKFTAALVEAETGNPAPPSNVHVT
jgi:O-antigen/teichoic acid export membrane protein